MNFDRVCATFDIQGFQIGNTFYAREFGIWSANFRKVIEFDCGFINYFSEKDLKSANYQTHNVHGLPLSPRFQVTYTTARSIVKTAYNLLATESKPLVACRNTQLIPILKELNIPFVDLSSKVIPSLKENWSCQSHQRKQLRCALAKAQILWSYVNGSHST